jgi:hypothetical protein
MALLTDGPISVVADLLAYEASLADVADAEGIDLAGKLQLAQGEVGAELAAAALRPGNIYWLGPTWNSTASEVNLSRFPMSQVVVTSPLKLWHTFQALAITYRDAYNRKLNDKYLPKWNEYKDLARWASNLLYQTGIGLVMQPIPKPNAPSIISVGGTLGPATVYAQMSWVGADGVTEGAASDEQATEIGAGQTLRVTPSSPPGSPYSITGWNVYVGGSSGGGVRQNGPPLTPGQAWTLPGAALAAGTAVGTGQQPDLFRTVPRFVQRG